MNIDLIKYANAHRIVAANNKLYKYRYLKFENSDTGLNALNTPIPLVGITTLDLSINSESMIMKLSSCYMAVIIAATFTLGLAKSAEASVGYKVCYVNGGFVLDYKLGKLLNPSTLAPGDIIGSGFTEGVLACNAAPTANNVFNLAYIPNSRAVYGSTVCETNIPGIGIKYYSYNGSAIDCTKSGVIISLQVTYGVGYPFSKQVFDLVRTAEALPSPGIYNLDLINNTIHSFWSGGSSGVWGNFNLTGDTSIMMNTCSVVNAEQSVSFGRLSKGEQVERSFNIELNQCGGMQAIDDFKNHVIVRFESALIMPNGRLANSTCSSCARETNIEIQNSAGAALDLNSNINFSDAQTIGDTGLLKSFKAVIKPGDNQGAGTINTYLNFVIDYI